MRNQTINLINSNLKIMQTYLAIQMNTVIVNTNRPIGITLPQFVNFINAKPTNHSLHSCTQTGVSVDVIWQNYKIVLDTFFLCLTLLLQVGLRKRKPNDRMNLPRYRSVLAKYTQFSHSNSPTRSNGSLPFINRDVMMSRQDNKFVVNLNSSYSSFIRGTRSTL